MIVIMLTFLLIGIPNICTDNISETTELSDDRDILNAVIRQLFAMFKDVIKNGDFENNIPVLDPYELDYATFGITKDFVSASANFTNCVVKGLGDYQLGPFNFKKDNLSIDFLLAVPSISLFSEYYEFGGNLFGLFSISGKGVMRIEVQDSLVNGKIYLKQSENEKSILISHFENVEFTIESLKSYTEFDGNIDEIANAMIAELLPEYLSRFSKSICATYGGFVIQAINSILVNYESWKIIANIL